MKKGNILIKNASEVVTCSGFKAKAGKEMSDLKIIPDGAVVIEEGIIKALGESDRILETFEEEDYQVIDASGKSVLPGFVDSHTHFVFGGYRAEEFCWRLSGISYMDIMQRGGGIINTVKATRAASKKELYDSGMKRLDSMLALGVTTVEGKSGYGLDCETEIKQLEVMNELDRAHPIDVVKTFLGAHAIPEEYEGEEDKFVDYIITEVLPVIESKRDGFGIEATCR